MIELMLADNSKVELTQPIINKKVILYGPRVSAGIINFNDMGVKTMGELINRITEDDDNQISSIQTYQQIETRMLITGTDEYHTLLSSPYNLSGRGYIDGKIHNIKDLLAGDGLDEFQRNYLTMIGEDGQVVEDRIGKLTKFAEGDYLINVTKNNDLVASEVV